ncbi:hypothetical protein SS1G_08737 [Sclerotinia sclerotiorum 1980 UF-70]|uniref:Cytochrome P450 n=1 Tax=Sclerotinia sclerotiorum (strain ATCC 18683 / 1980 / Ss-1) TaxID=665079 RepID=A7ETT0_SCLS1|nr:hypothetical protein SS1G_08737 [Sclerotinia sclerotiorum 1980 UF-70]EDN92872.1 hypothetical protein SS1G_08737 [Sclerotinia sclerotiorum 1980 UF-70]
MVISSANALNLFGTHGDSYQAVGNQHLQESDTHHWSGEGTALVSIFAKAGSLKAEASVLDSSGRNLETVILTRSTGILRNSLNHDRDVINAAALNITLMTWNIAKKTVGRSFCTWAFYRLKLHPLAPIPGPPHWILSRLPFVWALYRGRYVTRITELHEKYGPVVRTAANEVSFTNEQAWTSLYAPRKDAAKSPFWYAPRQNNGSYGIFTAPSGITHGRFRRAFSPAFTQKSMRELEPMILHHIDILISQLQKEASKDIPLDIVPWFEYMAFDIVGELSFSKSFHTLTSNENHHLVVALRKVMTFFTQAVVPRVLGLELFWQFIVSKVSRQKRAAYNKSLNDFTHERLNSGAPPGRKYSDLMTYFSLARADGRGLTATETENAIGDIMIAGSETVATTLTSIVYHLVRNTDAHRVLTSEVRGAFKDGNDITIQAVTNMEYLNAVINEAMRLCPSLPMVLPRMTLVNFAQLPAYISPTNFARPNDFIPERWLPDSTLTPHNIGFVCLGVREGVRE